MLALDELIFRARALGQSHPFSPRVYRYVNGVVNRERERQPAPDIGIWCGHAITAGYCLRCVEEDDSELDPRSCAVELPADLDEAANHIAAAIRTDGAEPFLLYPEPHLVAALDRMIAGEIERRLDQWGEDVDDRAASQLAEYLAWWTVKGYALRVADRLLPDEVGSAPGPDAAGV